MQEQNGRAVDVGGHANEHVLYFEKHKMDAWSS